MAARHWRRGLTPCWCVSEPRRTFFFAKQHLDSACERHYLSTRAASRGTDESSPHQARPRPWLHWQSWRRQRAEQPARTLPPAVERRPEPRTKMLALAALVAAVHSSPAPAALGSVPVFTWGERGYATMREPAVLLFPAPAPGNNGTLLAFAEAGQNHLPLRSSSSLISSPARARARFGFDFPESGCDIVLKTSTDGGTSWGPMVVVAKNASQPSPVYDAEHNQVVLNFNGAPHCADARPDGQLSGCGFNLAMSATIDAAGGMRWTAPVPIDGSLGDKGHAAVGHAGLELAVGPHKGRLLFIGHRGAYVEDTVWYTDDGGKTYHTSATVSATLFAARACLCYLLAHACTRTSPLLWPSPPRLRVLPPRRGRAGHVCALRTLHPSPSTMP